MESWVPIGSGTEIGIDLAILMVLMITGEFLRRRIHVLRRFLLPASLIAGFVGLMLGPDGFGVLPLSQERLGYYVYHLLALTFIGVGLQSRSTSRSYGAINLGFMQVSTMLLQGIIGMVVALVAALTFLPKLTPATGLLLPLGFAMGPGIAFSIGSSWRVFGFDDAANVGLTIAAIGFLVAYISGVWILSRFSARGRAFAAVQEQSVDPDYAHRVQAPPEFRSTDRLSVWRRNGLLFSSHTLLVFLVYGIAYVVVSAMAVLFSQIGLGRDVPILWSFHFIIANLLALGTRSILDRYSGLKRVDDKIMLTGTCALADALILTSIAGISLRVASVFIGPVLVMCLLGAIGTYALIYWTSEKIFTRYRFERFIGIYAQMTGTISSGLALVRATDPDYRTPVAQDLVLSSGMALAFGFPLLLVINLPFTVFNESLFGYGVILVILVVYLVGVTAAWYRYVIRNKSGPVETE